MAYIYCKCGAGLDAPTPREVLEESYACPICGKSNNPRMSVEDVMLGLLDRIEKLEAVNNTLTHDEEAVLRSMRLHNVWSSSIGRFSEICNKLERLGYFEKGTMVVGKDFHEWRRTMKQF